MVISAFLEKQVTIKTHSSLQKEKKVAVGIGSQTNN